MPVASWCSACRPSSTLTAQRNTAFWTKLFQRQLWNTLTLYLPFHYIISRVLYILSGNHLSPPQAVSHGRQCHARQETSRKRDLRWTRLPGAVSHDASVSGEHETSHTQSLHTRNRLSVFQRIDCCTIIHLLLTDPSIAVEEKKKTTLDKVISAKAKVRTEITDLSNKLKDARETINKFQQEIRQLEEASSAQQLSVWLTLASQATLSTVRLLL